MSKMMMSNILYILKWCLVTKLFKCTNLEIERKWSSLQIYDDMISIANYDNFSSSILKWTQKKFSSSAANLKLQLIITFFFAKSNARAVLLMFFMLLRLVIKKNKKHYTFLRSLENVSNLHKKMNIQGEVVVRYCCDSNRRFLST